MGENQPGLEQAVGWAVADDQELRLGVRRLAWTLLDQAYAILEHGRPQDKIALMSRLVTPMMKALGEEDQGGRGIDDMRTEFRAVLAEVRTQTAAPHPAPVDPGQELQRGPIQTQLGANGTAPDVRTVARRG